MMKLLHKFPVFVYFGAGILGYTAGEMFIKEDRVMKYLPDELSHYIPVVMTAIVIAAGLLKKMTKT